MSYSESQCSQVSCDFFTALEKTFRNRYKDVLWKVKGNADSMETSTQEKLNYRTVSVHH